MVNATGVFSEQVEAMTGLEPQVSVEPSKGVHLVLSRKDIGLGDEAIVLPETDDKRILFIVPWETRAIYGTTDTGSGDLNHPTASKEDVAYLLKHLNRYLSVNLTEADIISVYAGYRPLVSSRSSEHSTARLSRTHAVLQSPAGLVSIVGGKLTTYRRMAQDTVDVLNRRDGARPLHPTQHLPLLGSAGWPAAYTELQRKGTALGLDAQIIEHLGMSYGTEAKALLSMVENNAASGERLIADLPYIRAEVAYVCRQEMAMTPYDVLGRRMPIVLVDQQRGLGIIDEVVSIMAQEHNWSPLQQQSMSNDYRSLIESQIACEQAM
nr:FAD-dependent oxidoreductase [Ktedonosporobacter rubrisoli]